MNAKMVLAVTMSLAAAALPLLASESEQDGSRSAVVAVSVESRLNADSVRLGAMPALASVPCVPPASTGGSMFSQQIAGEPSVPLAFLCTGLLGLVAHYLRVRRV